MGKVYDSPAEKGMLFPVSSGAGDGAITAGAEGTVRGVGQFVIGEKGDHLSDAPQDLFSKLNGLDGKA